MIAERINTKHVFMDYVVEIYYKKLMSPHQKGFRRIGVVFLKPKPHTARPKRVGGRWGVAQGCNCRSILDAIASLIETDLSDLALVLIEHELNSRT
tara:strand:- start:132 stop:419 length:288 start_codon:yes stop_codon:yes gene_type:complete